MRGTVFERPLVPNPASVAPWFGSNRMLAAEPGRIMARRGVNWIGVPFGGSLPELPYFDARTTVIYDLHRHLINLVQVMQCPVKGPMLYRRCRRLVLCETTLHEAQVRCAARERRPGAADDGLFAPDAGQTLAEKDDDRPSLEWAVDYFCCCWMARASSAGTETEFKAGMSVRYDAAGGDSACRVHRAARSIRDWRKVLQRGNITICCGDGFDLLARAKDQPGIGIYCDSPFPGPGDRYKQRFKEADHRRLADAVGRFQQSVVVMRFYDHPWIQQLYPAHAWTWHRFAGRTQANKGAKEVLLEKRREDA